MRSYVSSPNRSPRCRETRSASPARVNKDERGFVLPVTGQDGRKLPPKRRPTSRHGKGDSGMLNRQIQLTRVSAVDDFRNRLAVG